MKYEKQNIFFISDLHIGHTNVIRYDGRPFADVDEMHVELIKRWNNVVGENDIVYYLGDLSFTGDDTTKWFINSIRGEIHFIMGNHDKMKHIIKLNRWENIYEYGTEIFIKDENNKEIKGSNGYQQIILSHYPILSWNRSHYGSWMIHGHAHQSLTKDKNYDWYYKKKVMDVGCNGINYTPISYQEVKKIMDKKEMSFHH